MEAMARFADFRRIKILGAATLVVIIASIAFALPSYNERMRRNQLLEAFQNLSDIQLWMEGFYQHYRVYARGDVCGAAVVPEARAQHFTYTCALDTTAGVAPGQSYTATATGKSRYTTGFIFTIDQNKIHGTVSIPSDWGTPSASAQTTWVDRKP